MFKRSEGFTLIELLVVILIIGILALIALPSFLGQQDKAKDTETKMALNTAYKVAKGVAASQEGNFFGGSEVADHQDLADAIEASEPQMGTVDVVTDATSVAAGRIAVVSGFGDSDDDLQLAGKSQSGAVYTLTVEDNGPPQVQKAN